MEKKFPATFHICHKIKDGCVIHKLRANLGLCAFIDRVFLHIKKSASPGLADFVSLLNIYIYLFMAKFLASTIISSITWPAWLR